MPLGKKLLFIAAHPDDETYTAAALFFENSNAGGKNFLVCATLGEKGTSKLKTHLSPVKLKQRRKAELLRACKLLQVRSPYLLGLPDGGVADHQQKFLRHATRLTRALRPDYIVSFGLDGMSGHRDHIAASKIAAVVAKGLKIPLFQTTVPPKLRSKAYIWFKRRRVADHYHQKEVLHGKATHMVPVVKTMKTKALAMHASQLDPKNPYHGFSKSAAAELWKAEYFTKKL